MSVSKHALRILNRVENSAQTNAELASTVGLVARFEICDETAHDRLDCTKNNDRDRNFVAFDTTESSQNCAKTGTSLAAELPA